MSSTSKCACDKTFSRISSLTHHQKSCPKHLKSVKDRIETYQKAVREQTRRDAEAAALREEHERQANAIVAAPVEEPLEVSWNPNKGSTLKAYARLLLQPEIDIAVATHTFRDYIPQVRGLQSARESHPEGNTIEGSTAEVPDAVPEGRRPRRACVSRRLPKRYRDILPEGPVPLQARPRPVIPAPPAEQDLEYSASPAQESGATVPEGAPTPEAPVYRTMPNAFGLFREYRRQPLRIPDDGLPLNEVKRRKRPPRRNAAVAAPPKPLPIDPEALHKAIHPFPNMSTYRLGDWFHDAKGSLSRDVMGHLINDVLGAEDFVKDDVLGSNFTKLEKALDRLDKPETTKKKGVTLEEVEDEGDSSGGGEKAAEEEEDGAWEYCDGWVEETVKIEIPTGAKQGPTSTTPAAHTYQIPGLRRRPLVEVIKDACTDDAAQDFHFEPFKAYYRPRPTRQGAPATDAYERVHDELYASDAWMEEQEKLEQLPPEPDCDLPRAIAALMFWSDATHVSQFGQSKMWPIYLFFGNLSKWLRCKPRAKAAHHVGHIPSVSVTLL